MSNLLTLYKQRLNLQDATFSPIEHTDATVAIVYKVAQRNSTPLILKIHARDSHYFRELYFLKYFAHTLPVPQIIETVEPEPGINGVILMEYLPGILLKNAEISDAIAYESGELLARVHINRQSVYGDLTQSHTLTFNARIYFSQKSEEGFTECSKHLPKKLFDQSVRYFDSHIHLLTTVDGPCLVHLDYRPGNLITNDGKIEGIIDWSSARAGFAQEDFIHWEHEVWSLYPASKKSFLAGYTSIRPAPDYQSMMPLLRLSKALTIIGFTVRRGTWNTTSARLYQFNLKYLETLILS